MAEYDLREVIPEDSITCQNQGGCEMFCLLRFSHLKNHFLSPSQIISYVYISLSVLMLLLHFTQYFINCDSLSLRELSFLRVVQGKRAKGSREPMRQWRL